MRNHKDVTAEEFAARLRKAALDRGHTSARNSSGVDAGAVAKAAGCSYEMARRYLAGLAVPGEEVMLALARWLNVSAGWLAFGQPEGSASNEVSPSSLEACLVAVFEAQELAGVVLPPARIAALAAALYREALDGRQLSARTVAASLRVLT